MARQNKYLFENAIAVLLAHARTTSKPHVSTNPMVVSIAYRKRPFLWW